MNGKFMTNVGVTVLHCEMHIKRKHSIRKIDFRSFETYEMHLPSEVAHLRISFIGNGVQPNDHHKFI